MQSVVKGYYQLATAITAMVYLNLLWIGFTIAGLVIFGIFPATVGLFSVLRKWNAGEREIPIFRTFWKTYRAEFLKANGLGFVWMIVGYLLITQFRILSVQEEGAYHLASFGVIALLILYSITLLYFFPIYVHFDLKLKDYFRWPFIVGIVHPLLTVFLAGMLILFHHLMFTYVPVLVLLIGGSVSGYLLTWGASKVLPKYEAS
jgi:uncharacterized membrane protein YesL